MTTHTTTPVTGEVLTKLAEMLAKATGPNRPLDGDIHEVTTGECIHRDVREEYVWDVVYVCNKCGKEHPKNDWPKYTASIDAALALVESMLPDWGGAILSWSGGGKYPVFRMERSYPTNVEVAVEAHTRPLAILSALVNALAASLIPTKENDDAR